MSKTEKAPDDTPPGRRRGRPRSIDREAILDRAMHVFWELGYDGASLSELTRAMGVSRPSLYAQFGDKDALFLAALERYGRTVSTPIVEAFDTAPDIRAAVSAFLDASLKANTQEARAPGCLFACCAATVAPRLPDVAARLEHIGRETSAHIAARFADAERTGKIAPGLDPKARAALVLDMMNAQAVRARSGATRAELQAGLEVRVAAVFGDREVD